MFLQPISTAVDCLWILHESTAKKNGCDCGYQLIP